MEALGKGSATLELGAPMGGGVGGGAGVWDLSAYGRVEMSVVNESAEPALVRARVLNAGALGLKDACATSALLGPHETREMVVRLMRRPEDPGYAPFKPFMMYFKGITVRDGSIDPGEVAAVEVSIEHPKAGAAVSVSSVRATEELAGGASRSVPFFPFVDQYGQYVHSDWPGKVYSDEDFTPLRHEEDRERAAWPGPADRDRYGGWASGPTVKATGFFYPAKHGGKWWLVDPEGKLFWSYGVTGVGFGGDATPVTGRENWFKELPARDGPWGSFYRKAHGATYMYYADRDWVGFDVAAANLVHKYGPEYRAVVSALSHDRLRSWGFNTLGNWSSPEVYLLRKTPYTVAIHPGSAMIDPAMPDVFSESWEAGVRRALESQKGTTANDPWNLGYFVDNERKWGWRARASGVGEETLKNGAKCASKVKFVEQLRAKYKEIGALNAAWKVDLASWDALLDRRDAPDMKNAAILQDCGDFGMVVAERYFSTVRRIVKEVAPNTMYLGSRFNGNIDPALLAVAGKYCDAVSYNIYDIPPDGRVNQYSKLDVPIIIGEWGVGSDLVQTPFRGENPSDDPEDRIAKFREYVTHVLRLPNVVGAHFFQYRDQPISGRPDGEATLRGFVNITDTPNFGLVQENRRLAYEMYEGR